MEADNGEGASRHLVALRKLGPPTRVPIDRVLAADSPRLDGEDEGHARVLAQSGSELPPILVHRATMRVIDGMHRLRAMTLRGEGTIDVQFFDGPEDAVFVLAVEANIAHGLPLSLRDREAAATRMLTEHPRWSDRIIARASGLSAKTVGAIRRLSAAEFPQMNARLGRDGRVRPLDNGDRRQRAGEFIAANPNASLREIARQAGIAPSTARDVRARMLRGDDPILPSQQRKNPPAVLSVARHHDGPQMVGPARTSSSILAELRSDPSLRFSDSGRTLLRWLDARTDEIHAWNRLVGPMPDHCSFLLAEFARCSADDWMAAAERLRSRVDATG